MLRVGLADVASTVDVLGVLGEGQGDPIDARDPEYIRTTLPTIQAMSRLYFRGEVSGLEHIPDGPVLLVGNHSGGTLIADTFVFAQAFYDRLGAERRFHQLAHDLVFALPGVRAMLSRYGTIPASPKNMRRALSRSRAMRRCWSIRAATTRPSVPRGSPPRSILPAAPGSSSWRWKWGRQSSRWWRSVGRRRRCSSARDVASLGECSSIACCA
jgi:Acyltransferase